MLVKCDLAKYPFSQEAASFVKELGLKIEELGSEDYRPIVRRAVERVKEAILRGRIGAPGVEEEVDVLAFPVAALLVSAVGDDYLKRRYALAEAKKAYRHLREERAEKLVALAREFGWRIAADRPPSDYKVYFVDFLRNAAMLSDERWKLVNRQLVAGEVHLNQQEVARLLQEEVRRHIEARLQTKLAFPLPAPLQDAVRELEEFFQKHRRHIGLGELLPGITREAFPPCMAKLYMDIASGKNVPHMGRFAITSFLLNIGMQPEEIVKVFTTVSDFSEKVTRYQVHHIAGVVGSRTKYRTLSCKKMVTFGLCFNPEQLCSKITNPLGFYRRKQLMVRGRRAPPSQLAKSAPQPGSPPATPAKVEDTPEAP